MKSFIYERCKYEDVLRFDVYDAIQLKANQNIPKEETMQEKMERWKNEPSKVSNNPLLLDYDYVYNHAEYLFVNCMLDYQQNQGTEAYYTLFKVLRDKYSMEDDYNSYLYGKSKDIHHKWWLFVSKFVEFFTYAFDERLEELLNKDDFTSYFFRYPEIYDKEVLSGFGYIGVAKLFEVSDNLCSSYLDNSLISLMRKHPKLKIPQSILMNEELIKNMARTTSISHFYFNMIFVTENCSGYYYMQEHKKYCDDQMKSIKDGILPCLEKDYLNSDDEVRNGKQHIYQTLKSQVFNRIFERNNVDVLDKKYFYQEFSKYIIMGMFISRNFEKYQYNLLIDIETLYDFAKQNNISLKGNDIYEFLLSFEDKSVFEIIEFYESQKNRPLIEVLYDDWESQKEAFVKEINSNIFNLEQVKPSITANGIPYYDITDITSPILVHNTSVRIDDSKNIEQLIKIVQTGYIGNISLSLHDSSHQKFYEKEVNKNKKTIKFLYGKIEPRRVGTIYHTDAYTQGKTEIEWENHKYIRTLYTLKDFLEQTINYNEIVYTIEGTPFMPIGVICEDEITEEEVEVAIKLGIKLFLRQKKEYTKPICSDKQKVKKIYEQLPQYQRLFN